MIYCITGNSRGRKHSRLIFAVFWPIANIFQQRFYSLTMALFRYFKCEGHRDCLPSPCGPLSKQVPSGSIEEANKEVDICYKTTDDKGKKRLPYSFATLKQKAKVAKYVTENGTANSLRHFSKELPNLKESTIRGWKSVVKQKREKI